jgi:hypothetical protein
MQSEITWDAGSFAGYVHAHVARTIGQLDTKVQILTGLATASLAVEFQFVEAVSNPGGEVWTKKFPDLVILIPYFGFVASTTLVLSIFCLLLALWPRVGSTKDSPIFFGGISRHHSAEDYAAQSRQLSSVEITNTVFIDAYELARIARTKSWYATEGTILFACGVATLIVQFMLLVFVLVFASAGVPMPDFL